MTADFQMPTVPAVPAKAGLKCRKRVWTRYPEGAIVRVAGSGNVPRQEERAIQGGHGKKAAVARV